MNKSEWLIVSVCCLTPTLMNKIINMWLHINCSLWYEVQPSWVKVEKKQWNDSIYVEFWEKIDTQTFDEMFWREQINVILTYHVLILCLFCPKQLSNVTAKKEKRNKHHSNHYKNVLFCIRALLLQYRYILRALKGTWKCALYEQLSFIYRLKVYALLINRKNEKTLNREWFVI